MVFSKIARAGLVVGLFGSILVTQASQAAPPPDVVATVNGQAITKDEFDAALARSARQKFYHGKVEEKRMAELRAEVVDELVRERLLAKEVERLKVQPNVADVDAKIAGYEEQYKDSAEWKEKRAEVLPKLRARMLENSRRGELEAMMKRVPAPSEAEVRAYYERNKDLFTEPSRDHVSAILLKVDPSSTRDVWNATREEAQRIHDKIKGGQDFAALAKLHSGDDSAEKGGDLGYVHRGMLAEDAQTILDKMKPGELSEPIEILQGYLVLKLHDRTEAKLRPFDDVKDRARDLYVRTAGEQRWENFLKDLRRKNKIVINEQALKAPEAGAATKN